MTNESVRRHQIEGNVNTSTGGWRRGNKGDADPRLQRGRRKRFPARYGLRNGKVLGQACKEVALLHKELSHYKDLKERSRACWHRWLLKQEKPGERKRKKRYDRLKYRLTLDKKGRPVYLLRGQYDKVISVPQSNLPAEITRRMERRK